MRRVIVPTPPKPEEVSPGVAHRRLYPGGIWGPNNEVRGDLIGGQTWTDVILLGTEKDSHMVTLPDIRMPPNQIWPLHWHDCWIAVVVIEGSCLIGDWLMKPGDVLITEAELEYGPLLIGPQGCRLFEIFAKHHLGAGGYASEYRDHPTLQGTNAVFKERKAINQRNAGHSMLAMDGIAGLIKGHLSAGAQWDLGPANDPDRSIMKDTRLAPGQRLKPHAYDDWHCTIVLDGALEIGGRKIAQNEALIMSPRARVGEIAAGPQGAQLFELSRNASGIAPRFN